MVTWTRKKYMDSRDITDQTEWIRVRKSRIRGASCVSDFREDGCVHSWMDGQMEGSTVYSDG